MLSEKTIVFATAVTDIANDGMPEVMQVATNLVFATGLGNDFDQ